MPELYKAPSFEDYGKNVRILDSQKAEFSEMEKKKQWLLNYLFDKWSAARQELDNSMFDIGGKKKKNDQAWFDAFNNTASSPMPLSTFRNEPHQFEFKAIDTTVKPKLAKDASLYRPSQKK